MGVNLVQLAVRTAGMMAAIAMALFLPAGTLAWPAGWTFFLLFLGFVVALTLWLLRYNPHLLAERMTGIGRPDQKTWDKVFIALMSLAFFAWLAVMGLEERRSHWSRMPLWLQGMGAFLLLGSFYLFYRTFRENPYLSPAVRVQKERAQTVVTTGPYRYVRHPMYAGFGLFTLGTALLLASWYGLLGAGLLMGMVAWRAVREERVLLEELAGYRDYMTRVRYRFIPYLW